MDQTYELIKYSGPNYRFVVEEELYCVPHIHKEIEIGLVLSGNQSAVYRGRTYEMHPGDMWIFNSSQRHECFSVPSYKPYTVLVFQILPEFFCQYLPELERWFFQEVILNRETMGTENFLKFRQRFYETSLTYLRHGEGYELETTAGINLLFLDLIRNIPHREINTEEMEQHGARILRVQRMDRYIEEHCEEKLLLSDLAEQEGLTLTYMSHFFKENFGMSFQNYLSRSRCRRARTLLRETNTSITEISIICGFSALKYLNQGFEEMYACKPKEYREACRKKEISAREMEQALDSIADEHLEAEKYTKAIVRQASPSFIGKGLTLYSSEQGARHLMRYMDKIYGNEQTGLVK